MRARLLALTFLAAQIAFGQLYPAKTGPDLAYLDARLSDSAYVVRGRLLESKTFIRTDLPPPEQIGPNLWRGAPRNSRDLGGNLYALGIEHVLCRKGDFAPGTQSDAPVPDKVHIYVEDREAFSVSMYDSNRRELPESFQPGREYLLFLYEQSPAETDRLLKKYNKLDAALVYHRTVDGRRGAVALPDAEHPEKPRDFITPLVQAVTTFCEAMKGPDAATKIRQLQGVRDSFDYPAWRQSVDRAIQELQGPPRRLP